MPVGEHGRSVAPGCERSSPIAIGWPPSTVTSPASPPAASIRSQTQSAAALERLRVAAAGGHRRDAQQVVELVEDRRHGRGLCRTAPRSLVRHAPPLPPRRGGGARGHDVLRGGGTRSCRTTATSSGSPSPPPACSLPPTRPGTLLGALPAGWLAARVGRQAHRAARTGAAHRITSVVFGFAQNVLVLDVARFAQGVGGACSWAGGLAWLVCARPRPTGAGRVIGSALGAAIVGVLLGPALGGPGHRCSARSWCSAAWRCCGRARGLGLERCPGSPTEPSAGMRAVGRALRSRPVRSWRSGSSPCPALFAGTLEVLAPLRLDELGASGAAIGGDLPAWSRALRPCSARGAGGSRTATGGWRRSAWGWPAPS